MLDQFSQFLIHPDQGQNSTRNEIISSIVSIKLCLETTAAITPLSDLILRKRGVLYYELVCDETISGKSYKLINNTLGELRVPDGIYIFVVIFDELGNLSLRIGNGNHYYLAEKRDSVFAAGEIIFQRRHDEDSSDIISINDKSGAYHNEVLKRESFEQVLTNVKLPVELFKPFKAYSVALPH